MNNLVVEFLGTAFLMFIILALGEPMAIGLALTVAIDGSIFRRTF